MIDQRYKKEKPPLGGGFRSFLSTLGKTCGIKGVLVNAKALKAFADNKGKAQTE